MNSPATPSPAPSERRRVLGLLAGLALMPLMARAAGAAMAAVAGLPPAPTLVLPDLDDRQVDLAALRGRVVVVNFWATWCPPCAREFPSLDRLQARFKSAPFTVLGVNVGEDGDTVFAFAGTAGFPVLLDKDSAAMRRWPVKGLPTTFVVDKAGRLAYRVVGGRDFDDPAIVAQIAQLLE